MPPWRLEEAAQQRVGGGVENGVQAKYWVHRAEDSGIVMVVKRCLLLCLCLATVPHVAGIAATPSSGDAENPFLHIKARNPFNLKDPPPPVTTNIDEKPPPPPAPLAKVIMTGILNVLGPPRVLLEVTETETGKQPQGQPPGQPRKLILREGEKDGSIEVISINIQKSIAVIKNGTVETNLGFPTPTQSGAGALPNIPSMPPLNAGLVPPPPGATPMPTPTETSSGRRGVVVSGNQSAPTQPLGQGAFTPGNVQVPSRQMRTGGQPQQTQGTTDPVVQWVQMRAEEERAKKSRIPFPPTPPAPGMNENPAGDPQPTGDPQGGPPPLRSRTPFPPTPPAPGMDEGFPPGVPVPPGGFR